MLCLQKKALLRSEQTHQRSTACQYTTAHSKPDHDCHASAVQACSDSNANTSGFCIPVSCAWPTGKHLCCCSKPAAERHSSFHLRPAGDMSLQAVQKPGNCRGQHSSVAECLLYGLPSLCSPTAIQIAGMRRTGKVC